MDTEGLRLAALLSTISTIHKPTEVDGYPIACVDMDCDHDPKGECPLVKFTVCAACYALADPGADSEGIFPGDVIWPCPTGKVLEDWLGPAVADPRIIAGVGCTWWGTFSEAEVTYTPTGRARLPVCPHCGSATMQFADEVAFWRAVDNWGAGHPGYHAMVEWVRGKHFHEWTSAADAYEKEHHPSNPT